MYILLDENKIVREIIPDINTVFPDTPIEERYPSEFIDKLLYVDDDTEVTQNLMYDEETGEFVEPPEPEPLPEPEPVPEPEVEPDVWDELAEAYRQGVQSAYDE